MDIVEEETDAGFHVQTISYHYDHKQNSFLVY